MEKDLKKYLMVMGYSALACFLVFCLLLSTNLNAVEYADPESVRGYHKDNGVACEFCHKVKSPLNPATSESCSWCHGSPEFIVTLTQHLNPNPHNSVHWGPNLECDLCHKSHEPSVNYCNTCHHSEFTVP